MPVTPPPSVSIPDPDRIPQRDGSQDQGAYSDNMDYWAGQLPVSLDDFVDAMEWTEIAANQTEVFANNAQTSANASATSASSAAAVANFKGLWSGLTGAQLKGISVLHNGAYWVLLNDLANVALSEPSPSNTDWAFSSGTRWRTPYTASGTLAANSFSTTIATSSPCVMNLPTMSVNDFIAIHNSPVSTQKVTLANASYTIRGKYFTASPGDDLVLAADEVAYLVCVATNILEVIVQK
jgi:hypothetical protein